MSRAITRCSACRHQILDSFAALAGVSLRPLPLNNPVQRPPTTTRSPSYRSFSTSRPRLASETPNIRAEPEQENGLASTSSSKPPSTTSPNIPWYLQVQTPEPPAASSRLHALEEIPPIPSDAPDIIHPMLSHLSTQIGLDNLSLLDLRDVYPPPALGSNLLMILGTARSYKHLNTSADRFCRWLRSKYKLAPYADGLLGRNEMKLKLRRKARRLKLAQSVGNTVAMGAVEGGDDGITTGWVCVNVGAVDGIVLTEEDMEGFENAVEVDRREQEEIESDEDEYENPPDDSGVVGFGTRDQRPRVVVQMFLEEKRAEMDLEGLWESRVQKREKKAEKLHRELSVKGE